MPDESRRRLLHDTEPVERTIHAYGGSRFLLAFTDRRDIFPWIVASISTVGSGLLGPALAWSLGRLFDAFTAYGSGKLTAEEFTNSSTTILYFFGVLGIATLVLNACLFSSWVISSELKLSKARLSVFHGMISAEMGWFEELDEGITGILARVENHLHDVSQGVSQNLGYTLQGIVSAIVALLLAFYQAWDVTLLTLSVVLFGVIISRWITSRISFHVTEHHRNLDHASTILGNALLAIDTVFCFNAQYTETRKYETAISHAACSFRRYSCYNALQIGVAKLVTLSMFVLAFCYGAHLVSVGQSSPGRLLTVLWACLVAAQSFEQVSARIMAINIGKVAVQRLQALLTCVAKRSECCEMDSTQECSGHVRFDSVSFSYPSSKKTFALEDIHMEIPAGETVFIIGSSGSGKSTIAALLLGLYDTSSGDIKVDGYPVFQNAKWLRQNIAIASHTPDIFNESLLENVSIAHKVTQHWATEIEDCLRFSGLWNDITQLRQGWDTRLGKGGSQLSGGQCQRLALSRARLREASILVLDEAMSALDWQSRKRLMVKLRHWRRGKTTIVITHDLGLLRQDDYVFNIHEGRITHQGSWKSICSLVTLPGANGAHASNHGEDDKEITRSTSHVSHSSNLHTYVDTAPCSPVSGYRYSQGRNINILSMPEEQGKTKLTLHSTDVPGKSHLLPSISPISRSFGELRRNSTWSDADLHSQMEELEPVTTVKPTEDFGNFATLPLSQIFSTVWPNLSLSGRIRLVGGSLSVLLHAASTPLFASAFAQLLVGFELSPEQLPDYAYTVTLKILGITVLDSTMVFLMHHLLESVGQEWVDNLRSAAIRRIMEQPRLWFDRSENRAEELQRYLNQCAEETRSLVVRLAAFSVVATCMSIVALVWSFIVCFQLALIGLVTAPLLYLLSILFDRASLIWEKEGDRSTAAAANVFSEALTHVVTVKALLLENKFLARCHAATQHAYEVGFKRAIIQGSSVGIVDASIILAEGLIFWYGSVLVTANAVPVSTVIAVFSLLLFSISNAVPQASSAQVSATRLLKIARLPARYDSEFARKHTSAMPMSIDLCNVTFRYPIGCSSEILRGLNLSVPRGRSTCIVGRSGCGKSTVFALLTGLYSEVQPENYARHDMCAGSSHRPDADCGIQFGGQPLASLDLTAVRSLIGYVPQKITIFSDTIADNICYGLAPHSPLTSSTSIEHAARLAGIDEFVQSLPDGYETRLGDGGLGLSAGQIQRLGFARAVVRQPQLLLLDEPTSNLDYRASAHIRDSIRALVCEGTTVLVATHSVEMMQSVDRLVVIEDGRATEQGTWHELMARPSSRLQHLLAGPSMPP